ncbi:MAG: penicillin-binding protein 2 [Planctomycetes bacterium]|nr:penicillin-binding protein 2 [Planctomycetota bacterium]
MYERSVRTIIILFSLLIVTFMSLAGRCFYLQNLKSEYYLELSTKQQRGFLIKEPQRGVILDSCGRLLAASNRVRTIFAEPRVIDNPLNTSVKLAPVVKMRATEIIKLIRESKNRGFVKIKVGATASQCAAARKIFGIGVQSDWQRSYPMGRLSAHAVGFTSVDNRGLDGIELRYDKELRGSAGQNIFLADAFRRPVQLKQQTGVLSNGVGIILTLDGTIQQFTRAELLKQYESYEAEAAVAIVASAKTGAILAMVSLPDYDPVDIRSADPNTFRNRVVTDQFEPGSMIKPIVVAIAIDNGTIDKDEKIFCEYGDYYGKGFGRINEYRNHRFGDLSIREVLIKSSNIGMAKIGQKMGAEKLYNGLKLFGFAKTTGVEVSGEVVGLLRPTHKWTGYSVTRIPYGYEVNVTAMQMLQAFCILASGGRAVQPYLVKAIVDSSGEVIKRRHSSPDVGYIIKPEVAKWIVNDCLVGVVNERENGGTGWRAKLEKWQVFGKTGTANIAKVGEKGYEDNSNLASFIAGAPAKDPAVIVLVSIRKPNGRLGKGDSGGAVASPVVGRILEKTLKYLRVPERSL